MAAQDTNRASQDAGRYFVYLRIKPIDVDRITDEVTGFSVNDDSVIVLTNKKRDEVQQDMFKFTNVFRPSCSQAEIFDSVVRPRLEDVMKGEDSLVFSYGTTNSGKSFTMQGTPSCPGIIPRALRAIFLNIGDSIDLDLPLKPYKNKDVIILAAKSLQELLKIKENILESVAESNSGGDANVTISSTLPENMRFDDNVPELSIPYTDYKVGVWVSFYEIYNEVLNDLLSQAYTPTALKVVNDPDDDSFYPEGLIHVPVASWAEAFDVYRAGKKKLQVSSTLMNRHSSRSHCVFTLKILVRPASGASSYFDLSSLSFCDLAGNERVSHLEGSSAPTSVCKKETLKINSSLLALNKCFVTLKSNIGKPMSAMPSFRDSKLTMVLKRFLTQRGKLAMLANISQDPEMLASTHFVLKMTAVAVDTKINVNKPKAVVTRCRRFSVAHGTLNEATAPTPRLQAIPEADVLLNNRQDVRALKSEVEAKEREIEELTKELAAEKDYSKKLERDIEAFSERQQLESEFTERRDHYVEELVEKIREYHKKEWTLLARYHNYQEQCENLFEQLADEFDLTATDRDKIVSLVIHKYRKSVNLAKEEIEDCNKEIEDLNRLIEEYAVQESTLKGRLIQTQSELEIEKELSAMLRSQIRDLQKQLESSSGPLEDNRVSGYEATVEEGTFSQRPVRSHRSFRWLSDEEDSPRLPLRSAATTAKKRKGRKKKAAVPEAEQLPQRATRRRLLPRTDATDHLPPGGIDLSEQELQPSPNTFMKSTRK